MILKALTHDPRCVLVNILAMDFLRSSDSSRAQFHLQDTQSHLVCFYLFPSLGLSNLLLKALALILQVEATSYEKAALDAISSLIAQDSDDDVALGLHFKVWF